MKGLLCGAAAGSTAGSTTAAAVAATTAAAAASALLRERLSDLHGCLAEGSHLLLEYGGILA